MTKDEALRLALEALKEIIHWYAVRDRNDVFLNFVDQNPEIKKAMKAITAVEAALEAKDEPDWKDLVLNHNADCESRCDMDRCGYKPYFEHNKRRCPDSPVHETIDVEYTPPQRTWVGLTEEEIEVIEVLRAPPVHPDFVDCDDWVEFARAIEAKLKEKNT